MSNQSPDTDDGSSQESSPAVPDISVTVPALYRGIMQELHNIPERVVRIFEPDKEDVAFHLSHRISPEGHQVVIGICLPDDYRTRLEKGTIIITSILREEFGPPDYSISITDPRLPGQETQEQLLAWAAKQLGIKISRNK